MFLLVNLFQSWKFKSWFGITNLLSTWIFAFILIKHDLLVFFPETKWIFSMMSSWSLQTLKRERWLSQQWKHQPGCPQTTAECLLCSSPSSASTMCSCKYPEQPRWWFKNLGPSSYSCGRQGLNSRLLDSTWLAWAFGDWTSREIILVCLFSQFLLNEVKEKQKSSCL